MAIFPTIWKSTITVELKVHYNYVGLNRNAAKPVLVIVLLRIC